MTTAKEIMDQASLKVTQMAQEALAIGAIYRFVLEGNGGGSWLVTLKGTPKIELETGESSAIAECTIGMSAADFVDMMEGRSPGQDLFFAGKMQIDGDMGLAMKLEALTAILS